MLFNKKNQVITALVTPFLENNEVDLDSLMHLIDFQINEGVDGLVLLGTTAESATLNSDEKELIIHHAQKKINNRVPVMLGVGSNCTQTTINNHIKSKSLGVDASLIVTPYYNNPSSENIYHHYKLINDAIDFPFILYHVPSRTNSKLTISDARKIIELKNCIGIKDATGSNDWTSLIGIQNKLMYSGDDSSASNYCSLGGDGVISVLSNFSPSIMKNLLQKNDPKYRQLCDALGCDTNPIPIKNLLKKYNIIKTDHVRMPLRTLSNDKQKSLQEITTSILED